MTSVDSKQKNTISKVVENVFCFTNANDKTEQDYYLYLTTNRKLLERDNDHIHVFRLSVLPEHIRKRITNLCIPEGKTLQQYEKEYFPHRNCDWYILVHIDFFANGYNLFAQMEPESFEGWKKLKCCNT